MPHQLNLREARKYIKKFSGRFKAHHIKPRSVGGQDYFNLFPVSEHLHRIWHSPDLFWNLTLLQVWNLRRNIHKTIFHSGPTIRATWLSNCQIKPSASQKKKENFEELKRRYTSRDLSAVRSRSYWMKIFGSADINMASAFLRYMFLYMIFGVKIIAWEEFFHTTDLEKFFSAYPPAGERSEAFKICFGNLSINDYEQLKIEAQKIIRELLVYRLSA